MKLSFKVTARPGGFLLALWIFLFLSAPAGTASSQSSAPQSDADRGCCVWKTPEIKCAYTNRKYCRTKAEELKVNFEFHKDKACKETAGCPSVTLP